MSSSQDCTASPDGSESSVDTHAVRVRDGHYEFSVVMPCHHASDDRLESVGSRVLSISNELSDEGVDDGNSVALDESDTPFAGAPRFVRPVSPTTDVFSGSWTHRPRIDSSSGDSSVSGRIGGRETVWSAPSATLPSLRSELSALQHTKLC